MDKKEALKIIEDTLNECEVKTDGPHIVVLDRGWIFHGNLIPQDDGESYRLTSCVNIRRWSKNGFGGLSKGAEFAGATLDACDPISFKEKALIFAVRTSNDWREK